MYTILKKVFLTVSVLNILMLNIAVGYLIWEKVNRVAEVKNVEVQENNTGATDEQNGGAKIGQPEATTFICDQVCQKTIEEKVAELIPSKTLANPTAVTQRPAKTKIVSYIPIPGAGNTTSTTWTNLAGTEFSFSKGDYVGFKEAYFEANMKLFNGNGAAYVRLYDVTNNRAVDGSEIQTSSQTSVAVSSGKISLWEGNNTYRVQARSLTADTTYFESGRIKIINEQ